jgi:DNA topoisomerase-1
MESNGIGRPSTYASVLTKLLEKQYVEKRTITGVTKECTDLIWNPASKSMKSSSRSVVVGEDKNKMVPTDIGINVNQFILDYFNHYADSDFTASMEQELDRLAKGDVHYKAIMQKFWKGLDESLVAYKKMHNKKEQTVMDLDKGKVIVVDKVSYTLRRTKYGPAIQFDNPGSKDGSKKFVSLKAYLKLKGMNELDEMGKDDIRLLISLPCPMNHDTSLKLHYGQYGFYLKRGEQSYSMFVGKHYDKDDVPGNILDLSKNVLERITSWTPKSTRV